MLVALALSKERGTSSSRRNWMELERQLRDCDSSDSEDGTVRNPQDFNTWPVRRLRTHIDYDNLLCCAGYNLRCVKWGPKDGIWEHYWTPMVAQGRPTKTCAGVSAIAGCATQRLTSTKDMDPPYLEKTGWLDQVFASVRKFEKQRRRGCSGVFKRQRGDQVHSPDRKAAQPTQNEYLLLPQRLRR